MGQKIGPWKSISKISSWKQSVYSTILMLLLYLCQGPFVFDFDLSVTVIVNASASRTYCTVQARIQKHNASETTFLQEWDWSIYRSIYASKVFLSRIRPFKLCIEKSIVTTSKSVCSLMKHFYCCSSKTAVQVVLMRSWRCREMITNPWSRITKVWMLNLLTLMIYLLRFIETTSTYDKQQHTSKNTTICL